MTMNEIWSIFSRSYLRDIRRSRPCLPQGKWNTLASFCHAWNQDVSLTLTSGSHHTSFVFIGHGIKVLCGGHLLQRGQGITGKSFRSKRLKRINPDLGKLAFFCLFLVSVSEVNCQNSLQKNPLCEKTFPSWDQEKRELLEWSRPLSCSGRSKVVRRWWLGWSYYRKTNFQLVCHQSLGCRQRHKREWRRSRHLLRLCALGGCSSRPCCQCRLKMLELCL